MFKLVFFVPAAQAELVKEAVFAAGGGEYPQYSKCAWQTLGTGQFLPAGGSNPTIGTVGTLERVEEYRVEILCRDEVVRAAVAALVRAHPYEEPAYEVYQVWQAAELPVGLP